MIGQLPGIQPEIAITAIPEDERRPGCRRRPRCGSARCC